MNRFLTLLAFGAAAALNAQNPFSGDAKQSYTGIKNILLRAADKMPEADYGFRTVPAVRTYGEMVAHVADIQVALCAMVKGEQKRPDAASKKTKADIAAALKASFDYCDPLYDSMTDAAGAQKIKMFGGEQTKLGVLNFNVSHDNEMYGNMVAFLRIKGIVPPSSEGRP